MVSLVMLLLRNEIFFRVEVNRGGEKNRVHSIFPREKPVGKNGGCIMTEFIIRSLCRLLDRSRALHDLFSSVIVKSGY